MNTHNCKQVYEFLLICSLWGRRAKAAGNKCSLPHAWKRSKIQTKFLFQTRVVISIDRQYRSLRRTSVAVPL